MQGIPAAMIQTSHGPSPLTSYAACFADQSLHEDAMNHLLIVSCSASFHEALAGRIDADCYEVVPVQDIADAIRALDRQRVDAVIAEVTGPQSASALAVGLAPYCHVPLLLIPPGSPSLALHLIEGIGRDRSALPPDGLPGAVSHRLQVSGLVLDRHRWQVELGLHEIALTTREFRLLDYMLQRCGQAMTRTAIIDHVWGPSFAGSDRVVDVNLSRLRRQLFDRADCPVFVRAIAGVGYKLQLKVPVTQRVAQSLPA